MLKRYLDRATQGKMTTPTAVRDRNSGKAGTTFRTVKCGISLQTTTHNPLPEKTGLAVTNEADLAWLLDNIDL
ncbi:MAG: hypothetical protein WCP85_20795 [Mariniphaga sp.]